MNDDLQRVIPGPTMAVAPSRNVVVVQHPTPPPPVYTLDLAAVENLLTVLGLMRTGLLPEVPAAWQPGTGVRAYRNPSWSIEVDQLAGDPLLHLRDLRFGWLHYVLDRAEARRLAHELLARCETEAPTMAGRA
jgi:hypothetical protein